jgi:hypothetical protein
MAYAENIILIPKGYESLARKDYKEAKKTHALAERLLNILGQNAGLHLMTGEVEKGFLEIKPRRKNGKSTQAELIQAHELAERVGKASGSRVKAFRNILTQAMLDASLVLNAHEEVKGRDISEIKVIDNKTMLSVLANGPQTLTDVIKLRSLIPEPSYVLIDTDLKLSTVQGLVKALGLEKPIRDYNKGVDIKIKSKTKVTKIERLKERRGKKRPLLA